jgi:uncharacterized protein YjiS (DUF1127 family)
MSITTPDSLHNAAGNRTADSVADVSNGVLGGIGRAARAVWRAYLKNREFAAHRLLVASLTDRQLADIGIRRDQVLRRDYSGPHAL